MSRASGRYGVAVRRDSQPGDERPVFQRFQGPLALSLEGQGRRDEALQQYRLVTDKTADVRIAIARLLIIQNLEKPPAARDWREVESNLSELTKELPDDPRVPILRAEVLMATDQADQARALLEQARDAQPDKFELWAALFTLAQRQNQSERLGTAARTPPRSNWATRQTYGF